MIYEYLCQKCDLSFDVIKTVEDRDSPEVCVSCKELAKRAFVPSRVHLTGTRVEDAEYNPGLGCITRGKKHRDEIAKQKGLIEVGNEKVDSINSHFDTRRAEKLSKSYDA